MSLVVRPARSDDYAVYLRLFPALGVDDPPPGQARWDEEMVRSTRIAEHEGAPIGFLYGQFLDGHAYVRQIVVDAAARQRGVGRALMDAFASEARSLGARVWHLNVKPDNAPAIRLYTSRGMAQKYRAASLRFPWSLVDALPVDLDVSAAPVAPEHDVEIEAAARLVPGQLAHARKVPGRLLVSLRDRAGKLAGAASFDPGFPGSFPFRPFGAHRAGALLRAIRPHALPRFDFMQVVVEDDPDTTALLLQHGARLRLETAHYEGAL